MKKLLIVMAFACAGAVALADSAQWQTPWFTGIGASATLADLKATNGSWENVSEATAEITDDGALELDLGANAEATFTVKTGTAEDSSTLQRLTVKGVFTPIAADELLKGATMAEKGAQVGFAVVSETTTSETTETEEATTKTTYKYYAWVGKTSTEEEGATAISDWVELGTAPSADATTELTIDLAYWTDDVTATFAIKADGSAVDLGEKKAKQTLTDDAKTVAMQNKTIASVSCTGSGTLNAVTGDVQLGVASAGNRKWGTVDEAIEAGNNEVAVIQTPEGAISKYEEGTTKLTPSDSSKELVVDKTSGYQITGIQTSTAILNDVKFTGESAKNLMQNEAAFRTFLTANSQAYLAANTTATAIQGDLEKNGDNGLPLWQSYALGIEPTASVKPALAEGDKDDTENIVLAISTLVGKTGSGDFTISYKVGDNEVTDLSAIKIPLNATKKYPITISFK